MADYGTDAERKLHQLSKTVRVRRTLKMGSQNQDAPPQTALFGPFPGKPLLSCLVMIPSGKLPRYGLTEEERLDAIRLLGKCGCRTSRFLKQTSLMDALENTPVSTEMASALVEAGCDSSAVNHAGMPTLLIMIRHQRRVDLDMIRALKLNEVGLSARDADGRDALGYLAQYKRSVSMETVDLLIRAGCRTDRRDQAFEKMNSLYDLEFIADRFDRTLQEYTDWEKLRGQVAAESAPAVFPDDLDWGR